MSESAVVVPFLRHVPKEEAPVSPPSKDDPIRTVEATAELIHLAHLGNKRQAVDRLLVVMATLEHVLAEGAAPGAPEVQAARHGVELALEALQCPA